MSQKWCKWSGPNAIWKSFNYMMNVLSIVLYNLWKYSSEYANYISGGWLEGSWIQWQWPELFPGRSKTVEVSDRDAKQSWFVEEPSHKHPGSHMCLLFGIVLSAELLVFCICTLWFKGIIFCLNLSFSMASLEPVEIGCHLSEVIKSVSESLGRGSSSLSE